MSCRGAAERFGVSASSAIRWRSLERSVGNALPKALGGDRRSKRIEGHAMLILTLTEETPDITLQELKEALGARGIVAGYGTLWRFFERRGITRKKRRGMPVSRTGPMS
jgi:transposase